MATQIVTRVLCDFCAHDEVETPGARTASVILDGLGYEIDVCEPHGKPLAELAETLTALGRVIPRRGRKPAAPAKGEVSPYHQVADVPLMCPACDTPWATRASLASHVRRVHNKTLAELEGVPLRFSCDFCDKAFSTPQGKAVHEQRGHMDEYRARKAAQETGSDTASN